MVLVDYRMTVSCQSDAARKKEMRPRQGISSRDCKVLMSLYKSLIRSHLKYWMQFLAVYIEGKKDYFVLE